MMNAAHLIWIIPICVYFGMLLIALLTANDKR